MAADRTTDTAPFELESTGLLTRSRITVTSSEIVLEKRMGRKETVSRTRVTEAVRARSVFYGEHYSKATDWLLLVDADGKCLMRLTVSTWGPKGLGQLVNELDLPVTSVVDDFDSKWRIDKRYPGTFSFFDRHPMFVGIAGGLIVVPAVFVAVMLVMVVQDDREVDRQAAAASTDLPEPPTQLGPTYDVDVSVQGPVSYRGTYQATVHTPADSRMTCVDAAAKGNWLVGSSGGARFRVPAPGFVGEEALRGDPWNVAGHLTNFDVVIGDYPGAGRYALAKARTSGFSLDGTSADKRFTLDTSRPSAATIKADGSGAMTAALVSASASRAELSITWTCRDPGSKAGE